MFRLFFHGTEVKPYLSGVIILYEGGVERFDQIDIERLDRDDDYEPRFNQSSASDLAKQRGDLERWLDQGGTLLTHERMFKGCESQAVILLSECWTLIQGQRRDALSRAVSDLCLVTGNRNINYDEVRTYFDVTRVDHDQDPVYPEIVEIQVKETTINERFGYTLTPKYA